MDRKNPETRVAQEALQDLYNEWEDRVLPEIQDLFGFKEPVPQSYGTKTVKISHLIRSKKAEGTEGEKWVWLYRRLSELRGAINASRDTKPALLGLRCGAHKGCMPASCMGLPVLLEDLYRPESCGATMAGVLDELLDLVKEGWQAYEWIDKTNRREMA
jgi:hypothetical protein